MLKRQGPLMNCLDWMCSLTTHLHLPGCVTTTHACCYPREHPVLIVPFTARPVLLLFEYSRAKLLLIVLIRLALNIPKGKYHVQRKWVPKPGSRLLITHLTESVISTIHKY